MTASRTFDYQGRAYKVRKDRGVRLSHEQTDHMLRQLLAMPDATFSAGGDTMVVVSDGVVYIATLRERIEMDEED